jgi:uncharacterized protein YndB with AHSA1/START domain
MRSGATTNQRLSRTTFSFQEGELMTHIEHSVVIPAPVEQVFSYASDYRHWAEWFEGVSDFTPTTAITRGNGTRYAYKARVMNFSAAVETEIHDFVQDKGWTGVSTKGLAHRTHWSFEPIENGTKFTYAMEYQLPVPMLGSLLDSLIARPQWQGILERSLNNLKQHFLSSPGTSSR